MSPAGVRLREQIGAALSRGTLTPLVPLSPSPLLGLNPSRGGGGEKNRGPGACRARTWASSSVLGEDHPLGHQGGSYGPALFEVKNGKDWGGLGEGCWETFTPRASPLGGRVGWGWLGGRWRFGGAWPAPRSCFEGLSMSGPAAPRAHPAGRPYAEGCISRRVGRPALHLPRFLTAVRNDRERDVGWLGGRDSGEEAARG